MLTNKEVRLISNFCWFVLTVNYLWVNQSVPPIEKIVKPILFYILVKFITGMMIELNNMRANNANLSRTNHILESSVEKFIQFYNSIEFPKALDNPLDTTRKLCKNIQKVTEASSTIIWLAPREGTKGSILMTPENKVLEDKISKEIEQSWDNLRNKDEATLVQIGDASWYYLVPIKTKTCFYGFIGVFWDNAASLEFKERLLKQVRFLAEWSAIIYERVHTESLMVKSIAQMEQKRISEEIHDLISGQLFSVVCAASALTRSPEVDGQAREHLQLIASTANQALSELRLIVHSLKASSTEQWVHQIKRYLNVVEKLHEISVNLHISEEINKIEIRQARALHRIIYEAVNNAVEHGHCRIISIELVYEGPQLYLTIADDGIGFDPVNMNREHQGIGLSNISNLAESMNAIVSIESYSGKGTKIRIIVPTESLKSARVKMYEEEAS